MFRLLFKLIIFFAIIFALISYFVPLPPEDNIRYQNEQNAQQKSTLGIVKDTAEDLGRFCDRNSQTCNTISSFFSSFFKRVKWGIKVTYDYVSQSLSYSQRTNKTASRPPSSDTQSGLW
ncbi:DUF5330 domain-containing protein [Bartonella sp. DGB2]|uniref:DUF5330 domain-containing protein n=1 Tax=Bartonella sp. DGB2 TaxID=3388426 RepID=UPI00398FE230